MAMNVWLKLINKLTIIKNININLEILIKIKILDRLLFTLSQETKDKK